jgi:hypothetical protein
MLSGCFRIEPRASLGSLPLSLIPTFAMPLWTIFHIVSLLQLGRITQTLSAGDVLAASPSVRRRAQRPMPRAISTASSGMSASRPSSMWMTRRAPAISSRDGTAPDAARFQRRNVRVGLIERTAMIT